MTGNPPPSNSVACRLRPSGAHTPRPGRVEWLTLLGIHRNEPGERWLRASERPSQRIP